MTESETGSELLARRSALLLELAKACWAAADRKAAAPLEPILEAAAELLEVERVGFWPADAEHGIAQRGQLYLRTERLHLRDAAAERPTPASPGYRAALVEAPAFDLRPGAKDPAGRFLEAYLARHGIGALLDVPVRLAGRLLGIIGYEHVGPPRQWTAGDRRCAAALAELLALGLDFAERRAADERPARASTLDTLTDLPNRRHFVERVERSLRALGRRSGIVAVLSVNVDRFGQVNESFGRQAGDAVLAAIARAITSVLRPADLPGRLDGSRFGVLIEALDEPWEAIAVAERVQAALGRPVLVEGASLSPTASIGMALVDESHVTTAESLVRDADDAMLRAQKKGRGRYEVLESAMRPELVERMAAGWGLRDALGAGQLALVYQPEYSLADRRLLGCEALLRWNRPGHGQLPAGRFLEIAESSGLIVPIGAWVLKEACRQARSWRRVGPAAANLLVRVNLSARQFERADLVETVAEALQDSGLPAEALCLEITETVLMSNAAASLGTLTTLKALGVRLAVDDFGTGYSSLAYLKRFPVDTLKIDRSFVEGLGQDPSDLPIIQAVLSLGRSLGLEVVAEGVERPSQEQTLRALGCERVQGFLYGRPAPPGDFAALVARPSLGGARSG